MSSPASGATVGPDRPQWSRALGAACLGAAMTAGVFGAGLSYLYHFKAASDPATRTSQALWEIGDPTQAADAFVRSEHRFHDCMDTQDAAATKCARDAEVDPSTATPVPGDPRGQYGPASSASTERLPAARLLVPIFFLQWLALWCQFTLFIATFLSLKPMAPAWLNLSEWAINTPIVLGIIGAVLSVAVAVGADTPEPLTAVVKKSLFDAAMATVAGGAVYVVNLALAIRIRPCIGADRGLSAASRRSP